MAKASAISAPLLGHQRYTVALPTAARSATPSIVRSAKPLLPSTFNVLRRIAWRAFSLRGRPGGRFPFVFSPYEAANNLWRINIRYHIIQTTYLESDTVSIESKSSFDGALGQRPAVFRTIGASGSSCGLLHWPYGVLIRSS